MRVGALRPKFVRPEISFTAPFGGRRDAHWLISKVTASNEKRGGRIAKAQIHIIRLLPKNLRLQEFLSSFDATKTMLIYGFSVVAFREAQSRIDFSSDVWPDQPHRAALRCVSHCPQLRPLWRTYLGVSSFNSFWSTQGVPLSWQKSTKALPTRRTSRRTTVG